MREHIKTNLEGSETKKRQASYEPSWPWSGLVEVKFGG